MATTSSVGVEVDGVDVEIDIPADREYDDEAIAELDEALVESIVAAEDADHEFLSELLKRELGSLYYEQQLD